MDKLTKCIKWPNGVVLSETESPDEMADGERGYFITKEKLEDALRKSWGKGYLNIPEMFKDLGVE